jgi:hypothetical protein
MRFRKKRRIQYYYDYNPYNKVKAWHAVYKVVAVILVVAGLVFLAIWLDAKRLARLGGPSDATTPNTLSYKADYDTFTTPYFEMTTPTSWEFEAKSSNPNKYVYYNYRHKLVRGMITVYIDTAPSREHQYATRMLPAKLGSDWFLKPDNAVTDHCNKVAPGKDRVGEENFTFKGVAFPCDNDATWYSALVGLENGSTAMKIKRPDGKETQYVIHYLNSSAELTGTDLVDVIRKFQIK